MSGPSLIALDFDFQAKFELEHLDYEKQLMKLVSRKERTGLIVSNASQSLFLFVDKHHVQVQLCYKPYLLKCTTVEPNGSNVQGKQRNSI